MKYSGKKVAIITSSHPPFDERIYWKFGKSLADGYKVCIISSLQDIEIEKENIVIKGFTGFRNRKDKLNQFIIRLQEFKPELVLCSQPFTVMAARKYLKINRRCKILLDVTEWYPENISYKYSGFKKIISYIGLFLFNVLAANLCDSIILGEISKKRRYDLIAPLKPKSIIGYYPVLKYFDYYPPVNTENKITLCYAGLITFERGILQLLEISKLLAGKYPSMRINLMIAGRFAYEYERTEFLRLVSNEPSINFILKDWSDYDKVGNLISEADICFDLRKRNFIYKNSLPIKLFEYMACGKPFIFSDILPIRKEIANIDCGILVDPQNEQEILSAIELYITNKELRLRHSENGRRIIESGRNWENESQKLIDLIGANIR